MSVCERERMGGEGAGEEGMLNRQLHHTFVFGITLQEQMGFVAQRLSSYRSAAQ